MQCEIFLAVVRNIFGLNVPDDDRDEMMHKGGRRHFKDTILVSMNIQEERPESRIVCFQMGTFCVDVLEHQTFGADLCGPI